jgi:hypothetical protein
MTSEWELRKVAGEWFDGTSSAMRKFASFGFAWAAHDPNRKLHEEAPQMARLWKKLAAEARAAKAEAGQHPDSIVLNDLADFAAGRALQYAALATLARRVAKTAKLGITHTTIRGLTNDVLSKLPKESGF